MICLMNSGYSTAAITYSQRSYMEIMTKEICGIFGIFKSVMLTVVVCIYIMSQYRPLPVHRQRTGKKNCYGDLGC